MGRTVSYCKYCGAMLTNGSTICGNCSQRLRLIRKIQKMVRAAKANERGVRGETKA